MYKVSMEIPPQSRSWTYPPKFPPSLPFPLFPGHHWSAFCHYGMSFVCIQSLGSIGIYWRWPVIRFLIIFGPICIHSIHLINVCIIPALCVRIITPLMWYFTAYKPDIETYVCSLLLEYIYFLNPCYSV